MSEFYLYSIKKKNSNLSLIVAYIISSQIVRIKHIFVYQILTKWDSILFRLQIRFFLTAELKIRTVYEIFKFEIFIL